jgi:hypothetical protein
VAVVRAVVRHTPRGQRSHHVFRCCQRRRRSAPCSPGATATSVKALPSAVAPAGDPAKSTTPARTSGGGERGPVSELPVVQHVEAGVVRVVRGDGDEAEAAGTEQGADGAKRSRQSTITSGETR